MLMRRHNVAGAMLMRCLNDATAILMRKRSDAAAMLIGRRKRRRSEAAASPQVCRSDDLKSNQLLLLDVLT